MTSPRVVYDSSASRFMLIATMTDKETFSKIYIAASKNSNPRSGTPEHWDVHVLERRKEEKDRAKGLFIQKVQGKVKYWWIFFSFLLSLSLFHTLSLTLLLVDQLKTFFSSK